MNQPMNELSALKLGLKTTLEAYYGAPVYVYDQPPKSINQYPSIVILALQPHDFPGMSDLVHSRIQLIVFAQVSENEEGWERLDDFMSRDGANSVQAAMATDVTWGSTVDTSWIEQVTNTGVRRDFGAPHISATFVYGYTRS